MAPPPWDYPAWRAAAGLLRRRLGLAADGGLFCRGCATAAADGSVRAEWPPPASELRRRPALAALVAAERRAHAEWRVLDSPHKDAAAAHAQRLPAESVREMLRARGVSEEGAHGVLVKRLVALWRAETEQRKKLQQIAGNERAAGKRHYAKVLKFPGGARGEALAYAASDAAAAAARPRHAPRPSRPALPLVAHEGQSPPGFFDGRPDEVAALLARAHARDVFIAVAPANIRARVKAEEYLEEDDAEDGAEDGGNGDAERDTAIVATALSARHMADLVSAVQYEAKRGAASDPGVLYASPRVEGLAPDSDWAMVEVGGLAVHVVVGDDARAAFALERLWRQRGADVRTYVWDKDR